VRIEDTMDELQSRFFLCLVDSVPKDEFRSTARESLAIARAAVKLLRDGKAPMTPEEFTDHLVAIDRFLDHSVMPGSQPEEKP